MRVTIELAGPPRGKGRPRATVSKTGFAHVYTDDKTVKYESQLRFAAAQRMGDRPPTLHPVRVTMTVAFEIPASWSKKKQAGALSGQIWPCVTPDADNTLKLADALNGIVWKDDKQIVVVFLRKIYSEKPGLTIEVESLEPAPPLQLPIPRHAREGSDRVAEGGAA